MGKDLHPSIIPFIERGLSFHSRVKSFELVNDPEFYIYHIRRNSGLRDLHVVLSDDYYFGDYAKITMHPILKDGGFILIARPEATDFTDNDSELKLGIGKIGKLLGALNKDKYWEYEPPMQEQQKRK
jgi:hypothetical protein